MSFLDQEKCLNNAVTKIVLEIIENLLSKEQYVESREFYYELERQGGIDLIEEL